MATVQMAIQIHDGLTEQMKNMDKTINTVIDSFKALETASRNAFDTDSIRAAGDELDKISTVLIGVKKNIQILATSARNMFNVSSIKAARDELNKTSVVFTRMNAGVKTLKSSARNIFNIGNITSARSQMNQVALSINRVRQGIVRVNQTKLNIAGNMPKSLGTAGGLVDKFKGMASSIGRIFGASQLLEQAQSIIWDSVKDKAASAFAPILAKIQEIASSPAFQKLADGIIGAIVRVASIAVRIFEIFTQIGAYISDNWSTFGPIFWGLAAALGAFALIAAIAKLQLQALFLTMLKNPIFWITLAIGLVVGLIYKWVQSVGGLDIAWKIVMNNILMACDSVKMGITRGVFWVMSMLYNLELRFMTMAIRLQDILGDLRVNMPEGLQNLFSDAINKTNNFINLLNKIPGAAFEPIQQMTFGVAAQLENDAAQKARANQLQKFEDEKATAQVKMDQRLAELEAKASSARAQREAVITAAQADKAKEAERKNPAAKPSPYDGVRNTAGNTAVGGGMAGSMSASEEELKYMRDLAEREVIDRTVLRDVTFNLSNSFGDIRETADVNEVIAYIENQLGAAVESDAEGGL